MAHRDCLLSCALEILTYLLGFGKMSAQGSGDERVKKTRVDCVIRQIAPVNLISS